MKLERAAEKLAAAGVESPRLEAQLLFGLTLGVTRTQVLAQTYPPPTPEQEIEFARLVEARAGRVPFAYLRGTQEFYGLEFAVSSATLIPRPETELLVECTLRASKQANSPFRFADVGTGSGCIPISVLVNTGASVKALALDLSRTALSVAEANAERHQVSSRMEGLFSDLLTEVPDASLHYVVSNPPYIETAALETLQPEVRDYEPRFALDGGLDGLEIYRRLLPQAARVLRAGGGCALEVGAGQAQSVAKLAEQAGFREVTILLDLAGIERVVEGVLP